MRILLFCLAFLAAPAWSDPEIYQLDVERSDVGFTYMFEGSEKRGTMPVQSARMRIDLDNVPASEVNVTLNPSKARAGFIFATQVMKGPEILDTRNHPAIQFRSTSIRGDLRGAIVTGDLTVRGVTRPVALQAGLFRQRGTEVGDRDNLTVLLTGAINRNDFGADGFGSYVGPMIGLRIIARISR
ncbi:YceI family protein [Roseovarius sp. 2305UL8-3]|uniref:YceI family protein n=1 Tax=Roseovarius conchicola TaxID=3121636 RepID=UPI003526D91B